MPEYTQAQRPLRVDTALGEDVLLLTGFNGLEAISQPYAFQLDMVSTEANLDAAAILRTPALITVQVTESEVRRFHGFVSRFSQGGRRDDLVSYRAEVVPWLWFLTLSRESRIYQEQTVPDILEQVFKRMGYSDFELRLTRSYPQRLYCVQYRETHLAFVSRLMEEEGIWYFFEHSQDKHLLVLTDDSSASAPPVGPETIRFAPEGHPDEYVVTALEREHRVHPGRMTLWEYDYLKPNTDLKAMLGEEAEEVYDFPGNFREADDGERRVRLLLEAEEARRQVVRAESTAPGLMPGCHFVLDDHFQRDANGEYFITQVQHMANAGGYRGWENDAALDYRNTFQCIPHATPYRHPPRTPRPVVQGSQSALVVGPKGEEVHVDAHGRIKVQFYWDRDGKRDEKSSCWVRVTTPWGGKGWGAVSVPRIGNEVIVAFEEGDPDRPLVIGSVYNADQTPPFSLPGAGIQMGMKSRSSPGGGGNNEITMTDTKGKEMMNIHAQYDQVTVVEHDSTTTVKNNRTTTVNVDDTQTVKGKRGIDVTGTQTEHVKAAVTENYDATQATTVQGDITINSKSGAITIKADSSQITVKAATTIQLEVGASKITMDSGGQIKIEGVNVAIKGSAAVGIKGMNVSSEADAQNSTKGALVISEGSATNTVKGGMVMLNP